MNCNIYWYKIIEGEYKGKEVYSFDCHIFISPNSYITCYDKDNEYLVFPQELEFLRCEDVDVPDINRDVNIINI